VLHLQQSTVSRHLKLLSDGGWLQSRPEGTRRLYRVVPAELDEPARELWLLTRGHLASAAVADERRLQAVLAHRRRRSREFFASASADWDRIRDDLFGRRLLSLALVALAGEEWKVADLGCGTGTVAATLAPYVSRVIAVDGSPEMLEAARSRLAGLQNVDLRHGDLESLPLEDRSIDAATLVLVLHHLPDPARALAEAGRILKPGAKLLIVDLLPHDRSEYRESMGHVWQGFSRAELEPWLAAAGMRLARFQPLAGDPDAEGPELFVATATTITA
jgi:ArsR family transcriptional regulator